MSTTKENGRAMRLLSRVLLVLGGVVAATTAAWLLSSASAVADPLVPSVPTAHSLADGLGVIPALDQGSAPARSMLSNADSSPAATVSTLAFPVKTVFDQALDHNKVSSRLTTMMSTVGQKVPMANLASIGIVASAMRSLAVVGEGAESSLQPALSSMTSMDKAEHVHGFSSAGQLVNSTTLLADKTYGSQLNQVHKILSHHLPVPGFFPNVPNIGGTSNQSGFTSFGCGYSDDQPFFLRPYFLGQSLMHNSLRPMARHEQPGTTPD